MPRRPHPLGDRGSHADIRGHLDDIDDAHSIWYRPSAIRGEARPPKSVAINYAMKPVRCLQPLHDVTMALFDSPGNICTRQAAT